MARKTSGKKTSPKGGPKKNLGGNEETPITISGGSIHVKFDQDFDEEVTGSTKKIKKAKHPNDTARVTRVVILLDGAIIHAFPPAGADLDKECEIRIKGKPS